MAYVQRIKVTQGVPINYKAFRGEYGLPEDGRWDNQSLVFSPVNGPYDKNIIYDKDVSANELTAAFLRQGNEPFHMDIEVRGIGSEFHGKTCELAISTRDTYVERELSSRQSCFDHSETCVVDDSTAVFTIVTGRATPYGLFGRYEFTLSIKDGPGGSSVCIGDVPLEFYYLPLNELPDYFKDGSEWKYGVELLLLRMFILPLQTLQLPTTPEAWIELVVRIAFGSRLPMNGKESRTDKHWLKYDSCHGSSSFSGMWGMSGLNIEAWLDAYRNSIAHDATTNINCYDQAAITEAALCLGLPHQQIHWEFHQVYGMIDADLVGWGSCNSPYFGNDVTKMRYSNSEDPERTGFRNHAYLSWSRKPIITKVKDEDSDWYDDYKNHQKQAKDHGSYLASAHAFEEKHDLEMFMIDACAGPHTGTQRREAYDKEVTAITNPETSIYTSISEDAQADPKRWTEMHYLGPGISKVNHTRPSGVYMLPDCSTLEFESKVSFIEGLLSPQSLDKVISADQIPALQGVFKTFISTISTSWIQPTWVPIRPYTTPDGTSVIEYKIHYAEKSGHPLQNAMSMRLALNNQPGAIQKVVANHLANAALSVHGKVQERSRISDGGNSLAVIGSYYIRAFQVNNIAIELHLDQDEAWTEQSTLMQDLLDKVIELRKSA